MSRRALSTVIIALGLVAAIQVPASASVTKYIDTPRNEWTIAVADGVHAWARDAADHPYVYSVWVKPDGGPAYQVSDPKNSASVGNIELANPTYGDVLVYSVGANAGRKPRDIRFWDLANREVLTTPPGINTSAYEYKPSISGDYLLFIRFLPSGKQGLVLYRFSDQTFRNMASANSHQFMETARLNGDYIVYDVCERTCFVYREQISTPGVEQAPNGRASYSPTVTADGTVYYVLGSPTRCGHNVKLQRWPGARPVVVLWRLSEGADVGPMDVYDDGVSTTLYFSRVKCGKTFHYGIYKLGGA